MYRQRCPCHYCIAGKRTWFLFLLPCAVVSHITCYIECLTVSLCGYSTTSERFLKNFCWALLQHVWRHCLWTSRLRFLISANRAFHSGYTRLMTQFLTFRWITETKRSTWLWTLFSVGLVIRLAAVAVLGNPQHPQMHEHGIIAHNLYEGHGFSMYALAVCRDRSAAAGTPAHPATL